MAKRTPDPTHPKKIVLAYSGGLDTSVILPWLKHRYPGVKLVCFAAELGQGDELKGIEKKAYASGADEVIVKDLRKEFAEQYCYPMLRAHATYEGDYLLGTSIARPLIAKHQVLAAQKTGADALGHGATGKGNDQVRFELTYKALAPKLKIISPWKDQAFIADGLTDRETAIDYARQHKIPIDQTKKKIYSRDRNLWHISHEGDEIEHPDREPDWKRCLVMSVPVEKAPAKAETVEITFKRGTPWKLNGKALRGDVMIESLNKIGGKHAVGQTVLVENRLVGMKSRGVYETPGGTILYEAHKALEQLTLERDLYHTKQQLALKYGEIVYYGQWFHPLREALQAFVDESNEHVNGTVKVKLYKGRAIAVEADAKKSSLYDTDLASFAMDGYDITAARGFIDLFGLPMQVRGAKQGYQG